MQKVKSNSNNFDVVISFAGEDRAYVEAVVNELKQANIKVFYDKDSEVEMWGKDLPQYLYETYSSNNPKHCVIFVSRAYNKKQYPQWELKSAQVRELNDYGYILPVRLEERVDMPDGILPTKSYIEAVDLSAVDLAEKIKQKLKLSKSPRKTKDLPKKFNIPRIPQKVVDPYSEVEKIVDYIFKTLKNRGEKLDFENLKFYVGDRSGRKMFRAMQSDNVLFFLDIWIGGMFGDNDINFNSGYGMNMDISSQNSATATGKIAWSKEKNQYVIELTNFSLLDDMGSNNILSKEELVNQIWDKVVKIIEDNFSPQ